MKHYDDGEPCNHPGCRAHITHPCEGCYRIGASGEAFISDAGKVIMKSDAKIVETNIANR